MKARLSNLTRWLARIGLSLRRILRRSAKPDCTPQHWQGGQVI